jgi:hypothetical protein
MTHPPWGAPRNERKRCTVNEELRAATGAWWEEKLRDEQAKKRKIDVLE